MSNTFRPLLRRHQRKRKEKKIRTEKEGNVKKGNIKGESSIKVTRKNSASYNMYDFGFYE
jgi:hypothetical protein